MWVVIFALEWLSSRLKAAGAAVITGVINVARHTSLDRFEVAISVYGVPLKVGPWCFPERCVRPTPWGWLGIVVSSLSFGAWKYPTLCAWVMEKSLEYVQVAARVRVRVRVRVRL